MNIFVAVLLLAVLYGVIWLDVRRVAHDEREQHRRMAAMWKAGGCPDLTRRYGKSEQAGSEARPAQVVTRVRN